ncbi:hypothetical protein H0H92_010830 [Tricholoma furcatifolium]|nr:hypothetical protein H0H92_010830 [Tricholoma furcatifolium]
MASPELAHIVSQIKANVDFLVSQNHLSSADASAFLAKLPSSGLTSTPNVSSPFPAARGRAVPPPAPAPAKQQAQARALWAYNESGENGDDLSFAAGETIDILEETNSDWWTGQARGRSGLFPSAYVQKIAPSPAPSASPGISTAPFVTTGAGKTPYRPFGAAMHGADVPPPAGAGVNSVGLQQQPGKEEKKSKFGKYGNTMAQSAAGGVGFGAGAAIGGGLVRAIF